MVAISESEVITFYQIQVVTHFFQEIDSFRFPLSHDRDIADQLLHTHENMSLRFSPE